MKIIFLNRFFHPDHSATSQLVSDLAFAQAQGGRQVYVITGRQRYEAPRDVLPSSETIDGVSVHRVWTSRFGRANLAGRAVDYATFYLSAAWRLWRLVRLGDVVIAKTDPPMLSVIAAPVCALRRARLINWLQDIFPEAAQALEPGGRVARLAYSLMRALRNCTLRGAHMNVVLGERMAKHVLGLSVAGDRVRIVHNWADGTSIVPIDHHANALRADWNPGDAFVVAYSGNLGRAHDIDTLLEAMCLIGKNANRSWSTAATPSCPPVLWVFIGGGALSGRLKAEVARRGLTSVRFEPYQPRTLLAQSLSAADVHLVSLRPELEGFIVPSKFYGIAAAGRPTIFVGDENGEIARLVARHRCGRTVAVGDGAKLAQTVLELAADQTACQQMGRNARQAFEAEFDKPLAMAHWDNILLDAQFPALQRPAGACESTPSARNAR